MEDRWLKLWQMATGEPNTAPASISVDEEDPEYVTLTWPNGGGSLYIHWYANDWQIRGSGDSAPCDVAARDSL